jgi:hypothetical protein
MANALRAGFAARSLELIGAMPVLLVYAPAEQLGGLVDQIEAAPVNWKGKAVVFCDCRPTDPTRGRVDSLGAAVAVLRSFGVGGRMLVEGERARSRRSASGLRAAHGVASLLRVKPLDIPPEQASLFDAVVTIGAGAITLLIDEAAQLLRRAGIQDSEASQTASALFEQTARDYARSGRQSWVWYAHKPDVAHLQEQLNAVPDSIRPLLRQLLLMAFEKFGKHEEVASQLRC